MSEKHVIAALSDYLDGTAREPEAIAAHLKTCSSCAQHYKELAQVSKRMRTVSAPEVSPAFTKRVMANVRETSPARSLRWVWAGGTAVAVLLLLLASLPLMQSGESPSRAQWALIGSDPDELMDALEQHIYEDNAWVEMAVVETPQVEITALPMSEDALLEAFASTTWFDSFSDEVYRYTEVNDMLDDLTETESELLRTMLTEYVKEG